MATEKQKRATHNLLINGGNIKQAMRDAGYSEKTLQNPHKLRDSVGFKEASIPLLKQLSRQRQKAIRRMDATVDKASYRDVNDGVDKLTKNIQLLGGKPTENIKFENLLSEIEDE